MFALNPAEQAKADLPEDTKEATDVRLVAESGEADTVEEIAQIEEATKEVPENFTETVIAQAEADRLNAKTTATVRKAIPKEAEARKRVIRNLNPEAVTERVILQERNVLENNFNTPLFISPPRGEVKRRRKIYD